MRKNWILLMLAMGLTACQPSHEKISVIDGTAGSQGAVGPQGPAGPPSSNGTTSAIITAYYSNTCTSLGQGYFGSAKNNGYEIFSSSSCQNSDKVQEMNDANSTLWLTSSVLAVFASPNGLHVISFQ